MAMKEMSKKVMSKKKANAISNGVFLISLAILIVTGDWWPGIILAIWATLVTRQFLTGRYYYAVVSSVVFLGIVIVSHFQFDFDILAPVLLVIGGLFIIVREYFFTEDTNGEDKAIEIIEDSDVNQ
jgi:hypothetical protein